MNELLMGGCRVCRGILKPEEVRRGTCEACEEKVNLFISKQLDRKVRVG